MDRRKFLKLAATGAVASTTAPTVSARDNHPPIPGASAMLYDSTLCVGCQACVSKCQQVNQTEKNPHAEQTWSKNDKLSPYTRNVIQMWSIGDGDNKDQLEDGYAFMKKQCMHCVDPNCVSVCPVQAMRKDPKTGIVSYDPDVCTGCRYCMVACPFSVPKYDYENPFGMISKCEMCNQKGVERIDNGELPGCVDVCPTGAVIYGTREELLEEAKRRIDAKPGEVYAYPRQYLHNKDTYEKAIPEYQQHVYGEKEGGGTQVLTLAAINYDLLNLPALDDRATGARSETVQHTVYKGLILPLAAFAGLSLMTYRSTRAHDEHTKDAKVVDVKPNKDGGE